jgi:hypothetical protein
MDNYEKSNTASPVAPRRSFFRLLLAEAVSLAEEVRGKPQMRLSDLDQVPNEVVRQMVPVFNEKRAYSIEDDRVLLKHKKTGTYQEIYQLDLQEKYMLKYFDGQHTLEAIGRRAAEKFELDEEVAYQQVKALFILLAKHAICHPAQAHEEF